MRPIEFEIIASGLVGTVLSLLTLVFATQVSRRRNPMGIPVRVWIGRHAAKGIGCYVLIWGIVSIAMLTPIAIGMRRVGVPFGLRLFGLAGIALGLPSLTKALKDGVHARYPTLLGTVAQRADHLTTVYFKDVISEVAGKVCSEIVRGDRGSAIHRAFDSHLDDLVTRNASRLRAEGKDEARALRIPRVLSPMTKLRYLMNHFRYRPCLAELDRFLEERRSLVRGEPIALYDPRQEQWPIGDPDDRRRVHGSVDDRKETDGNTARRVRRYDRSDFAEDLLRMP